MKSASTTFNFYEYGNGSDRAVALVTGFGGQKSDLEQAAINFSESGHDVVLYEYPTNVLLDGDSHQLPDLIKDLSSDFSKRSLGHQSVRFCGVSLGGAIAANMQKTAANPERGFFAATGGNAAEIVMRNPWFRSAVLAGHHRDVTRAFQRNGHTLETLRNEWADIQEVPATPLTFALGGMDHIMRTREVQQNIQRWRAYNPDIEVMHAPSCNHFGTIQRFNHTVVALALNKDRPLVNQSRNNILGQRARISTDKFRDKFAPQPAMA